MNAAQVAEQIEAAFGGLAVPPPRELIRHHGPRDQAGEEQIRKDLAGKTWQSLTPEFLKERWAAYCYLAPEAYRYYLPALLKSALLVLPETNGLPHPVVYALCPSFWSLYYEGEDRQLRERQAVFSPAQYRAVCSFLGLAFEEHPTLKYLAAQAVRWGWSGYGFPIHEAVREYYHQLHHYQAPDFDDPERSRLAEQIRAAFAEAPYPGDHELCGSEQGDEPAEYAMEFRGLCWRTLHPEFLARNYAALSFLSEGGFRYFLPAFLLADLTDYDSNANSVFHLTHGFSPLREAPLDPSMLAELEQFFGPEVMKTLADTSRHTAAVDWRGYSVARFAGFTQPERRAIVRYLEYRLQEDGFDADAIAEALANYWRPSLSGGR